MNETFQNTPEQGPEMIPTAESVQSFFEKLLAEGERYETLRKSEDENGLYLWDVVVSGEGGPDRKYLYMRKGEYPEGQSSRTCIYVALLKENGKVAGGSNMGEYTDGRWRLVP